MLMPSCHGMPLKIAHCISTRVRHVALKATTAGIACVLYCIPHHHASLSTITVTTRDSAVQPVLATTRLALAMTVRVYTMHIQSLGMPCHTDIEGHSSQPAVNITHDTPWQQQQSHQRYACPQAHLQPSPAKIVSSQNLQPKESM
jgi:hypothetical protein